MPIYWGGYYCPPATLFPDDSCCMEWDGTQWKVVDGECNCPGNPPKVEATGHFKGERIRTECPTS